MAKIAAGKICSTDRWTIADVVCSAGPRDRPYQEQHLRTSIALVLSGTFQYRCHTGQALMTPGSLFLANRGECFECGHEHGVGDRCLSIGYSDEFFAPIADQAGLPRARFDVPRLPPVRALTPLSARAASLLDRPDTGAWEEVVTLLAGLAASHTTSRAVPPEAEPSSLARVTRVVRMIENEPDAPHDLAGLAGVARLSSFHFLRTFEQVTGTTPHQYLLRTRLRRAAAMLATRKSRIADVALDCGFGDISNFNRTFRGEFGMSPRAFRATQS